MLIVREAMRHGGQGWLNYDKLFQQQAALNPGLRWNVLHPELQATTILSQRSAGSGVLCSLCHECDHTVAQCALGQLQQVGTRATINPPRPIGRFGKICTSWNDGACVYPGACNYCHVCYNCFHPSHPARECWQPPRAKGGPTAGRTTAAPRSSH